MYGLTEAFRSTYLPPEEVDRRPDSIGKAIPGAEVLVLRPDGTPCAVDEPGELVHRGALVSLGYWNDPERTAERFRPVPPVASGRPQPELAVWSGDIVRRDAEGFLYFIGRRDEMIKTSGYRVSPTEVEEEAYATGLVGDAVAVGVPHARLGHGIVLVASAPARDRAGYGRRCWRHCDVGCRATWCRWPSTGATCCRATRTASSTASGSDRNWRRVSPTSNSTSRRRRSRQRRRDYVAPVSDQDAV